MALRPAKLLRVTAIAKLTDAQRHRTIEVVDDFVPDARNFFWTLLEDFYRLKPMELDFEDTRKNLVAGGSRDPRKEDSFYEMMKDVIGDGDDFMPKWRPNIGLMAGMVYAHTKVMPEHAIFNFYRDGNDYLSHHYDPETMFGPTVDDVVVATLSFGATRMMNIKAIAEPNLDSLLNHIELKSGSLVVMRGQMQRHWLHAIPKMKNVGPRLSITFVTGQTSPSNELAWTLTRGPADAGANLLEAVRRGRGKGGNIGATPIFCGPKREVLQRWIDAHVKDDLNEDEEYMVLTSKGSGYSDIFEAANRWPELKELLIERELLPEDLKYDDPAITFDALKDEMSKWSDGYLEKVVGLAESVMSERI